MDKLGASGVSAMTVIDTSALLVPYIFGIGAFFLLSEIPNGAKRKPYQKQSKEDRVHRRRKWFHLPSMNWVKTMQFFVNAFTIVSAVYYLYVTRDPIAAKDKNYYLTIEVLFLFLGLFKLFWQHFQFNHFEHNIGLALAVVSAVGAMALSITLFVLLAIRAAYLAMGMLIPVFLYYTLAVGWAGHIAQYHWYSDW